MPDLGDPAAAKAVERDWVNEPVFSLAGREWQAKNTALEAAFLVLLRVDYTQTVHALYESDGRYTESNPLIGEHPSHARLRNYMIAAALGHAAISYTLRPDLRGPWQGYTVFIEISVIAGNYYSAGIGIRI